MKDVPFKVYQPKSMGPGLKVIPKVFSARPETFGDLLRKGESFELIKRLLSSRSFADNADHSVKYFSDSFFCFIFCNLVAGNRIHDACPWSVGSLSDGNNLTWIVIYAEGLRLSQTLRWWCQLQILPTESCVCRSSKL